MGQFFDENKFLKYHTNYYYSVGDVSSVHNTLFGQKDYIVWNDVKGEQELNYKDKFETLYFNAT